jgi:hypothetical protein
LIHTILRAVCSHHGQTDDCAFGADDVAGFGLMFRKLRFLMIADTNVRLETVVIDTDTTVHTKVDPFVKTKFSPQ